MSNHGIFTCSKHNYIGLSAYCPHCYNEQQELKFQQNQSAEITALRDALTAVERENEDMKQSIREACDYLNGNRLNQIGYGSSIHRELRRHI